MQFFTRARFLSVNLLILIQNTSSLLDIVEKIVASVFSNLQKTKIAEIRSYGVINRFQI